MERLRQVILSLDRAKENRDPLPAEQTHGAPIFAQLGG
jgi:hypothetical protein